MRYLRPAALRALEPADPTAQWTAVAVNGEAGRGSEADGQAYGQQRPEGELEAAGHAQRADQRRARRPVRAPRGPGPGPAGSPRRPAGPAAGPGRWPPRPRTGEHAGDVQLRVRASPSITASVRLPDTVSEGMSRRLLITSRAQASSPTGSAAATASQGSESISTTRSRPPRPARRTRTPRSRPSRGSRTGGGRRCRSRPPPPPRAQQDQPPRGHRGQHQPGHAGHREAAERGVPDLPGRGHARRDQPDRADPHLVGAADPVAVVVGVVHPDLQGQGDDQGQDAAPQREVAVAEGDPGPHHDRDDRGGQGTWPRPIDPVPGSGH